MVLITPRLILRDIVEDDWAASLEYQSDPRYLRSDTWTNRTWTNRSEDGGPSARPVVVTQQQQVPRTRWQLARTLSEDGDRLIGNCGIRQDEVRLYERETRSTNIGHEVDPRNWGRGLRTVAARELARFGFEELRLHRIWAECVADNTASAQVLANLGMQLEGRARGVKWSRSHGWGYLTYEILDREFAANRCGGDA